MLILYKIPLEIKQKKCKSTQMISFIEYKDGEQREIASLVINGNERNQGAFIGKWYKLM